MVVSVVMQYILSIFCLWLIVHGDKQANQSSGWYEDHDLLSNTYQGCDFPIVDGRNALKIMQSTYPYSPVILRNLTTYWAAHELWKKDKLIDLYGDRLIKSGSESSIVYSAGHAEVNLRLRDFLRNIANNDSEGSSFAFDTTILSSIPEFKEHFQVPPMFADWDSMAQEERQDMWHMLSVGRSHSGLPFHNHGKTWLAVIYGYKYWFVYPPGYGPPREVDSIFSPVISAAHWHRIQYPAILEIAKLKAPLDQSYDTNDHFIGYRPLECLQRPGDVLYLPSMWSHMTMNVGETIAIGGQQYLHEEER
jgi:histone arginine demethylase JMJD6